MRKIAMLFAVLVACVAQASPIAERVQVSDRMDSSAVYANSMIEEMKAPTFTFDVSCTGDCGGTGGWREVIYNTVVTQGKTQLLDCQFAGSGCVTTWYVMLKHSGSIVVGDTLASHVGWTEANPYAGNRPAISWNAASGNSKAASAAVSFSITGTDADVAGACIVSANTGTTGTLYSCSNFGGVRSVLSGDTVTVTPTVQD